ncbi:deoxycytidine deaminase [Pseudoalteromonas rubra]|uniref:Deoxycytidine deaminase n=1 Tax=Pseudoalteromonas rubra TaxID=43658 RepID=A0A4Q7E383_9GAMM|nr:deoxycytidine deaminase [Pseudoalteromonas rubra]RZM73949.1 deoxycytidine deaminase [Pseudoalteromonas rubra]
MVVVGDNLKGLIRAKDICDEELFDEFSIKIKLDRTVFRLTPQEKKTIRYGAQTVEEYYKEETLESELLLRPGECVLACSSQIITMPLGYIGFVQTKGTLARLFVAAHCADAQIEPGFSGKVTLELMNHSLFDISIPVGANIAQVYVMRCSTDNSKAYKGKYQSSEKPTLPLPIG